MNDRTITYFDEIDFDSDDFFETEIVLNCDKITLNLEFRDGLPKFDWTKQYENYISKLDEYKQKVDKAIIKDFKDEETTLEYIEHHIDELDDLSIEKLIKDTDQDKPITERLLSTLKLQRIGFRFDDEEFAAWDYTLGSDITNYILAVYTDKNGKVTDFSIES